MRMRGLLAFVLLPAWWAAAGATPGEQPPAPPPDDASQSEPAPEKPKNTLRWTTASEVDNFGFDVYRGEKPDGPFRLLTERPIAGAGTSDTPNHYTFVDEAIDPQRDYYYYVESISMSGERKRFTPVIRAPAKRRAAKPESEASPEDAPEGDG